MNKNTTRMAIVPTLILAATATLMQGCIDEVLPTDYATDAQLNQSANPGQTLLNGLNALMVDQFTYNGDQVAYDWGYPCQMVIRDILGGDVPVVGLNSDGSSGDYLYWIADNSYLSVPALYTYSYYYDLIANANRVVSNYGDYDSEYKAYAGAALAYRALAYMDLTRMFEFKATGFEDLDAKAEKVMGLTVPIVDENTTKDEAKNNPRAPFYKMYRFIMDDLERAESLIKDFDRGTSKILPDLSVVYGLKARLWLEMASRFDQSPEDLSTMHDNANTEDGYRIDGFTTADDCYASAAEYAQKAIESDGYYPLTKEEWHDSKTGFNTANHAWMWAASMRSKEMISYQWYTWTCWMAPESSTFSWGQYFDSFRAIDKSLFDKINRNDWRRKTWIAPIDAGENEVPDGYSTIVSDEDWKNLPAYTALKFRVNNGETSDYKVGMLTDIPLMRIEEMYFIYAEATAHVSGVEAGKTALENFMNNYRYNTGKTYKCNATDMDAFITELLQQKRVELWGEGLTYFDNKRLARQIKRYYSGSNYPDTYQLNSKKGYVAPWLNYYIYDYERDNNQAVILNPDPSNTVTYQTDY